MHEVTVTAVGKDRPGIVAGVTKVFLALGCNLADCSMTRLSGQFAMILLVQSPDSADSQKLARALDESASELGLSISVREARDSEVQGRGRPFVISVYGADRPGIVHGVAASLAELKVNITDLVSHVAGHNIYMMVLEIDLPGDLEENVLREALDGVAAQLGVEVTLRPAEAAEL